MDASRNYPLKADKLIKPKPPENQDQQDRKFRPTATLRWAKASLLVHEQQNKGERPTAPTGLSAVVMTTIRLTRWERLKESIAKGRLLHLQSRGMPPIFGFLGKVSAKGKKALINSIVLLILNIIFISCSALAISTIENNYDIRLNAMNNSINSMEDMKWFIEKPWNFEHHLPMKEREFFPHHRPGHDGWGEEEWGILKEIHKNRCFKLDNAYAQANLWNFWSSFDFCATVLTTIGYGSMYPRTTAGKWFCIIYSICGIPIMAMYLALFSKGICTMVTASISAFSTLISKISRSFEFGGTAARVYSLIILLLALVGFIVMWSAILNRTNQADSMVKCMYFYVITLTTVGLGDISMTEAKQFVIIRVLFLFCVGLTLVTSVFNALRSVSAAHTRMIQEAGSKLKTRAQDAMLDGAQKFMRHGTSSSQLTPLTKEEAQNGVDPDRIETTFTVHEYEEAGGYHQYRKV